MHRKAPWRSKREGHHPIVSDVNYPQASWLESILAKRCAHTWEDLEINQIQTQNQAKQDD